MVGGPESYGAGGYTKTPLEETLPVDMGVRDRQKQPDVALVVVIDKSGSMDACHCNTFEGGRAAAAGHRRRPQGRHRQGGDPAGRGGADRARRARRGGVQRGRRTGSSRPSRSAASSDLQGPIAGIRADGQTNIFAGPRPGGAVARGRDRHPPPHHPADRRLVELRPVRRDPRADEGRRDHALDGRRGRRLQPVPRGTRDRRAAAASTTRRTRPASPTSSSRRPSRSPASRSSRSRSSRS